MCAARAVEMIEAAAVELFMAKNVRFINECGKDEMYDQVAAKTELDVGGCRLFKDAVEAGRRSCRQQGRLLMVVICEHYTV